jgi:YARHG domain
VLSNAKRGHWRDARVKFLAPAMAESTWVMSTSPTNADDRLDHAAQSDDPAQSFPCVKDQGLPSAVASAPDCPFPGATAGRSGDRKSDDAESAQTTVYIPVTEPQVQRLRNQPPPRRLSPASVTVMSNHGYVGTPMLRRRRHGLARARKLLVASTIAATLAGCVAVEIWLLVADSDLADVPQPASRSALPAALSPKLGAVTTASEAARVASRQSAAALQPTAQQEGEPADSTIGAPLAQTSTAGTPQAPWLEPPAVARPQPITALEPQSVAMSSSAPIEKIEPPSATAPQPRSAATSDATPIARSQPAPTPTPQPQPRAIAMAESTWIGRLGPALESPPINQAAPRLGKAAPRVSLLFKDSDVRYLSRAELETLSADQLHIARNEIFARRGRFFKDDALRAYFLQFPWYRPHAWEVPLSPVEYANVALIQSVEEANLGSASEARVAASRGIAGPLPAQTQAENGDPFADPGRRHLTPEQLQGLSADQLAIVRNQIFARRGRYFKDDWLRTYFSQFPWYRPYAWEVPLSPLEQANVKLVQSLEETAAPARPAWRTGRGPPM